MPTKITEARTIGGRFRGGKLAPVMALALRGGEGGMLSQNVSIELDPIAGRLITPITLEVFCVYVPLQAMDVAFAPESQNSGITEVIRRKLANGDAMFSMGNEDEITKRCGIMPRSTGGVKQVNYAVRHAHTAAVNFLRKRRYVYAAEITNQVQTITPAILSRTVLDMFGGVLDPDDHVNGMVNLTGSIKVPVTGVGLVGTAAARPAGLAVRETDAASDYTTAAAGAEGSAHYVHDSQSGSSAGIVFKLGAGANTANRPLIWAEAQEATDMGELSLTEFYNAEKMDDLARQFRAVIDANPQDGEERVLRMVHGLQVDTDANCFLLYERSSIFGQNLMKATDAAGIEGEVTQSRMLTRVAFTVPVPRTELGGIVMTFCSVKPDETLKEQPHPLFTVPWVADNLAAQELQLDPYAVTFREVQGDVAAGDEALVAFYTGYNELRRSYVQHGYNRQVDPASLDLKNQIWQYEIPASVTPENVIYPDDISHYPFLDETAEVARYIIASQFVGVSPIFVGPSPVETVGVIESENLFEDLTP